MTEDIVPSIAKMERPSMGKILSEHFEEGNDWHGYEENVYHSSWAMKCTRQIYYKVKQVPETNGGGGPQGLFIMGHKAEEVVLRALRTKYGFRFVRQSLPVLVRRDGYVIKGETDPAIYDWNMVPVALYDSKTSMAGKRAKTKIVHKAQIAVYAKALKFPETRVVHPSRNDLLDIPEEDTVMDQMEIDAMYDEAIDWFDNLRKHELENVLPPARPTENTDCKWCPFLDKCRQDGGWTPSKRAGKTIWSRDEPSIF